MVASALKENYMCVYISITWGHQIKTHIAMCMSTVLPLMVLPKRWTNVAAIDGLSGQLIISLDNVVKSLV